VDFNLLSQGPDEVSRGPRVGDQARHWLAVLRYDQPFRGELVQESQALLLELCGTDSLHGLAFPDIPYDQSHKYVHIVEAVKAWLLRQRG